MQQQPIGKRFCLQSVKMNGLLGNNTSQTLRFYVFLDSTLLCRSSVAHKEKYICLLMPPRKLLAQSHLSNYQTQMVNNNKLGNAKVAPKSAVTLPRLELCATVLGIEIANIIK